MSGLSANASAIKSDAEFDRLISEATSTSEIKSLMQDRAVQQGLVSRDQYDPAVLIPIESAAQPQLLSRTVTINGNTYTLQGANDHDLNVAETNLYRSVVNPPAIATQSRDESTGRYTATPTITAEERASLDLQFQLGQLSSSEYLERSGAVADYLANRGIPIAELQAQVAATQDARETQDGEAVVQEFLNGPAGSSWPGGSENLNTAARLLKENDLSLTVPNLVDVFAHMTEYHLIAENPELAQRGRIMEATTVEQIREAVGGRSSLFGQ